MEFWEGAILVVGGLFLIDYMSKRSANHPINSVPAAIAASKYQANLTTMTNEAGANQLTWGEPLTSSGPQITGTQTTKVVTAVQKPVVAPVIPSGFFGTVIRKPLSPVARPVFRPGVSVV